MERGYHILVSIGIGLIGLIVTVTVGSNGGKYAGLCVLLFGCYVSAPLTAAWLSGNTPGEMNNYPKTYQSPSLIMASAEPGKRTLVLGVNGFGNLAGVIGAQVYRADYGPTYRTSFFITLGFSVVSFLGYLSYRFTLAAVNRRKQRIVAQMTPEEIDQERVNNRRYADRKHTFIYGL